ncbi:MAG: GDP-mannose mannosyl hydrolase [Spartobacteria bacterium]|nr:GDP-mannose mannosyl hydrolase [Spartobacteria bacterium]
MKSPSLSQSDFSNVVRLTPLVSIDLILRDDANRVLLGLRANEPAKGFYFVPGGRIRKDETLYSAFARILATETGCVGTLNEGRLLGVFEHLYEKNPFGDPGYGTHYVVVGYEIMIGAGRPIKPDAQHTEYAWWKVSDILSSPHVHENTKAYFR